MKTKLLVCKCGSCTHWELAQDAIICKTCQETITVTGLGLFIEGHTLDHPKLEWQEHER